MQMSANAGKVVDEVKEIERSEGSASKRQRTLMNRWACGCIFYSCNI